MITIAAHTRFSLTHEPDLESFQTLISVVRKRVKSRFAHGLITSLATWRQVRSYLAALSITQVLIGIRLD